MFPAFNHFNVCLSLATHQFSRSVLAYVFPRQKQERRLHHFLFIGNGTHVQYARTESGRLKWKSARLKKVWSWYVKRMWTRLPEVLSWSDRKSWSLTCSYVLSWGIVSDGDRSFDSKLLKRTRLFSSEVVKVTRAPRNTARYKYNMQYDSFLKP